MAELSNTHGTVHTGLERIPYVVVMLPDGKLVLRHPDELKPQPFTPRAVGQ